MSGLDKIINGILLDAKEEAKGITDSATRQAQKITARAEEEARAVIDAARIEAQSEKRRILSRAESTCDIIRSRAVLHKKQTVISDVLKNVGLYLRDMDTASYFEYMSRLLDRYAQNKTGEIILCSADKDRITPEFSDCIKSHGLTVSVRDGDFESGFILVYGNIEENCVIASLLEAERDRLHDAVSDFLF